MGMEIAEVEIEIGQSDKSISHNNKNNNSDKINQIHVEEEEIEKKKGGRIGGILHPNEKLPRPEPPRGIAVPNDDVSEVAIDGGGKDGIAAVGRFIRQRSTAIARRLALTEDNGNGDGVTEVKLAGVKVIVQEKKKAAAAAAGINALKGRVTFFSRSNCRDCGAVRSFCRLRSFIQQQKMIMVHSLNVGR